MILVLIGLVLSSGISLPFPLLGTLGPESGNVLVALLGPFLLIAAARSAAQRNTLGFASDLRTTFKLCLIALGSFSLLLFFNGFRFQSCSPDGGLYAFLLIAAPPLFLSGVSGAFLGRICGRPWLATFCSCLFFVVYLALQVACFFQQPSLRVVTHFSIITGNDLLSNQTLSSSVIAYRAATFCGVIFMALLGLVCFPNTQRKGLVSLPGVNWSLLLSALFSLFLAITVHIFASHSLSPSRKSLAEHLSYAIQKDSIVVHTDPLKIDKNQAHLILNEALFWKDRLEKRLGNRTEQTTHIWLYPDQDTMAYYTGGNKVHFALPAFHEIHLTYSTLPHPTLGHELAHILVGKQSNTFWGVPGKAGFLPNTGLTEGLAVALTPELSLEQGLTLEEQAAAMYQVGYRPSLDSLFSYQPWQFWSASSSQAYTLSGAFIAYLLNGSTPEKQSQILKNLSQGKGLYRQDFEQFYHYLSTFPLPPDALETAKNKFKPSSLLFETCDAKAIKTEKEFMALGREGKLEQALNILHQKQIPIQHKHYILLAETALNLKQPLEALEYLQKISTPQGTEEDGLASIFWLSNQKLKAVQLWQSIDAAPYYPGYARGLMAKKIFSQAAVCNCPQASLATAALKFLLNAYTTEDYSASLAILAKEYVLADKQNPSLAKYLAAYVLARAYINTGNEGEALPLLMHLNEKIEELPSIFRLETRTLLARCLWKAGKNSEALQILETNKAEENRKASLLKQSDNQARIAYAPSSPFWDWVF